VDEKLASSPDGQFFTPQGTPHFTNFSPLLVSIRRTRLLDHDRFHRVAQYSGAVAARFAGSEALFFFSRLQIDESDPSSR
jgi:hypothetical protein